MKKAKRFFLLALLIVTPSVLVAEESEKVPTEVVAEEAVAPVKDSYDFSTAELIGRIIIYLGLLVAIGASVSFFFKRGKLFRPMSKEGQKLVVKETHVLGNKQFLVVVEYDGQKIMLGVGPGMINKLCYLNNSSNTEDQLEGSLPSNEILTKP